MDYKIDVFLDEKARRITAKQSVDYTNNSPDTLKYLWLQLDQNRFKNDSMALTTKTFGSGAAITQDAPAKLSLWQLRTQQYLEDSDLGYTISNVKDGRGNALKYIIVDTNMRIDLAKP